MKAPLSCDPGPAERPRVLLADDHNGLSLLAAAAALIGAGWSIEAADPESSPPATAPGTRTPVLAGMRLPIVLKLPDDVRNPKDPVVQELTDSLVEHRWIVAGPNGLAGKRIEFPGLQLTITDVFVRFEMLDGTKGTTIVRPSQPWMEMAASQT